MNMTDMASACVGAQWGPVEYHEQSLKNLGIAMQRTKRLCATVLDTVGREIMIIRPYSLNEVLPPLHFPSSPKLPFWSPPNSQTQTLLIPAHSAIQYSPDLQKLRRPH